jgi:hypothetical protein
MRIYHKVPPGKASVLRVLRFLSEQDVHGKTLDGIATRAHKDLVVYHVNQDSTAIPVWEQVAKEPEGKVGQKQTKSPPRSDGNRKAG